MKMVPLSSGRKGYAFVDDGDFEKVSVLKWQLEKHGKIYYASHRHYIEGAKGLKVKVILLHRFVLDLHNSRLPFVDHKDGNGIDCRKANLRTCTNSQNQQNLVRPQSGKTSRFKGVSCKSKPRGKKWNVAICLNGKRIGVGSFDDEIEAARAYDRAAIRLFGEFAAPNFPRHEYEEERVQ